MARWPSVYWMLLSVFLGTWATNFYSTTLSTAQRDLPPALQSYWFPPHLVALIFSYATLGIAGVVCLIYFCTRFWSGVFSGGRTKVSQWLILAMLLLVPFFQITGAKFQFAFVNQPMSFRSSGGFVGFRLRAGTPVRIVGGLLRPTDPHPNVVFAHVLLLCGQFLHNLLVSFQSNDSAECSEFLLTVIDRPFLEPFCPFLTGQVEV